MDVKRSIKQFSDADRLIEFLEKDLQNLSEVGAIMEENGTIRNIKVGQTSEVSMNLESNNDIVGIHTHPTVSGLERSEGDIKSTDYPNVKCSIILCQEMFEPVWNGVCFACENMEVTEEVKFKIEVDGVIDGPKKERYISSANVIIE
jgi:hypothetical protein